MSPGLQLQDALLSAVSGAVRRASEALLSRQLPEGYWRAELTADTTLESDCILLELWLHPPQGGEWNPPTRERVGSAARSILARQLPDGGFNIYPRGPAEISASVKAYFALKVAGVAADDARMTRLRERILSLGGIQAANSYTKINLSLFNLFPREHVPSVPPEMMLAGNFIYEMSSWTRAIVIPLAIVQALNPGRPVPDGFTLQEIFLPGQSLAFARDAGMFTWRNAFVAADRFLKSWERRGWKGLRRKAIRAAEAWMLERFRQSDGLGAIYPPMMYAIMALDLLGYAPDHPVRVEAERQFAGLIAGQGDDFHFQPCFSPVWDTGIAMHALGEAGAAPREALRRAGDWLLAKEVRHRGDWSVKRPRLAPSGWYFEFANEFYPDIDDTAQVLLGLRHGQASDSARQQACQQRAVEWLLNMQSRDGGWAAFDADNNCEPLSCVPFADHNAMLDPTCPDITGRVMEALCTLGVPAGHAAIRRGAAYLVRTQEQDGSWYGRWGVNYIYGTFLALRGLRAAGHDDREAHILRAGEWLRSIQNADGGWGESCAGYESGTFVAAESTASQTAWAILGLLASGDVSSSSVVQGVEYLVGTQRAGGTWREELATGTGFPGVFYLTYHSYRNSFPLLALANFQKTRSGGERG
ncbi:MAG: squalene--hopene cyclase [Acidobacteria bacterium]|nr:squalene--hopene cyclase [Acidobacteriota bacterium]